MFSGTLTALVTPFRDGKLDESRLREQIEFQIKGGVSGLVPCGTTGESPTLTVEEHVRVIELTVEVAAGRVPVVAGTGANSTAEAVRLHRHAKDVGAAAGLSVNPYYNKPSQEGMYRHFSAISEAVADLPIVLYNIPGRTGVTLAAATIARLAASANIAAVKEATGSVDQTSEIMSLCDLPVLSGDDSLTLALMCLGGTGVISVLSNLLPDKVSAMTAHAAAGDFAAAREIHHRYFPLVKSLFLDGNPVGVKHAMKLLGRDSGEMRLPLAPCSERAAAAVAEQLKRAELI